MLKHLFLFILTISLFSSCQQEQQHTYKTASFQQGIPEVLQPYATSLPFNIKSYAVLEGYNDSLTVYAGYFEKKARLGNYVALAINNQINHLSAAKFVQDPENQLENDIDIPFNDSKSLISFRIKALDTLKKQITYSWVNQTTLTDSITVMTIDHPLAKGNALPDIELTDINRAPFRLKDYSDHTLVLNWWHTRCAPCKEEIPGLDSLAKKYTGKKVMFVAITDDSKEKVSSFLETKDFAYTMTFISKNDKILFGNSYPKNLVIDKNQNISFFSSSANKDKWLELDQHLQELETLK